MFPVAIVAFLGIFAAAQQPQVQEQELPKPGQAQAAQPAKPAKQPETSAPQPTQPQSTAPAPQPAPTETPAPQPAAGGAHVPAPEESERGKQGKPVAAFWTVIPGK